MSELSDEDIKSAYLTGAFASADDWTVVGKYVTEFARAIIAAALAQCQPAPVQAALAYHAALNETLNDTNVQLREDVAGYQAALTAKDAEIAALKKQLASLARGVKISIPTDTMEHEFQIHYRRGVASRDAEIAALRQAVIVQPMPENITKSIFDGIATDPKVGQFDAFNWFTAGVASAEQWQKVYLDAAIAQAVQPT